MTHSIKTSDLSCLNGLPFGESFDTLISEGKGITRTKGDKENEIKKRHHELCGQ